MDNHYHLIVETPLANLSVAMQWLGVSYSTWFNRRHRRVGHLFQGRFKGILLEPSRALALSRYLHLNPVAIKRFGLDKTARKQGRAGLGQVPEADLVRKRLEYLRGFRWSSYAAYVGRKPGPEWLETNTVLEMIGGKAIKERRKAYRKYVENEVREGMETNPWEGLVEQVLLGSEEFVHRISGLLKGDEREQRELRVFKPKVEWETIVRAMETVKKEKWEDFCHRYGDWGRDLALYIGRRDGGMKLKDLGEKAGGMDYSSVAMAVHRIGQNLEEKPELTRAYRKVNRLIVK
jgi:hypothetical protein